MSADLEFVDTNIIVYAYDKSDPQKHELASKLLERLWRGKNGCLSIQVLQEFYVTLTHKLLLPLPDEQVIPIIADFGLWKHHVSGIADIIDASGIQRRYQISFWDAMIINSAHKLGCKIIWTEGLNHGQLYEDLKVVNPFK